MANGVSLSQDELDRVLNNIRHDNSERESKPVSSGIALSQADLDKLFGAGATATVISKPHEAPAKEDQAPVSEPAPADNADALRAAKIAERKARAAEMLARVNASSPKRITVIYGSVLRKGDEISALQAGTMLELDRAMEENAEIQVDGKPFAYGKIGSTNGKAAVKITRLL